MSLQKIKLAPATMKPFTNAMTRNRLTSSRADRVFVPMSALTQTFMGLNEKQVRMSPGSWDPTADMTTDLGGTGLRSRTNETGADHTIQVIGTTCIGIVFASDKYSERNADNHVWEPRPGFWRSQLTTNGTPAAAVYGQRPPKGLGGWMISTTLTTTDAIRLDVASTHPVDAMNEPAAISSFIPFDYMREIEQGFADGEFGAFHDIVGYIVSAGAIFQNVTDPTGPYHVVVIGNSNEHGYVLTEVGRASVALLNPGSLTATTSLDAEGHFATWVRQLANAIAVANGQRLCMTNLSYGQLHDGILTDGSRQGFLDIQPGFATDEIDRCNFRTGYSTGPDGGPFVKHGRVLPVGYAPDLVIHSGTINAQLYSASIPELKGATYRNSIVSLFQRLHVVYPGSRVLAVNAHCSDAGMGNGTDSHARYAEAMGVGYLDHAAAANEWLMYLDIRALLTTGQLPDGLIHLTPTQHTLVKNTVLSAVTAFAVKYLPDFRFVTNSFFTGMI